jgi:hypothetical protein
MDSLASSKLSQAKYLAKQFLINLENNKEKLFKRIDWYFLQ